jgi:hypothetical protein
MNRFPIAAAWPAVLLSVAMTAAAQTPPARPDPLDPQVDVPRAIHRSPLAAYRRAGDVELASWREVNDTVTRIGGWRVYAREASGPEPAASAPTLPAHRH